MSSPRGRSRRRSRAPFQRLPRDARGEGSRHRPDRHARPLARAADDRRRARPGADVYVQKPISVDVVEGQAMVAAARKHKRVVQVGTQRRSTPHLIEARDRIIKEGKLGKIGLVEIYCYYHMRATREPAGHRAARLPRLRDVDRPGADAALQLARPSARLAGVHGVRQRHRRRHVHPHARHGALDARPGLAEAHRSTGGILVRQGEQGEHHRHADGHLRLRRPDGRLAAPHLGACRPIRSIPGARPLRRQGHAQGERDELRLHPRSAGAKPIHRDVTYELEQYPEDQTEKDLERHVAPAIRGHMRDFLEAIATRGKPVADIEQGHISTASCILANLSMQARPLADVGRGEAAGHRRRRSQPPVAAAVSQAVGASGKAPRKRQRIPRRAPGALPASCGLACLRPRRFHFYGLRYCPAHWRSLFDDGSRRLGHIAGMEIPATLYRNRLFFWMARSAPG